MTIRSFATEILTCLIGVPSVSHWDMTCTPYLFVKFEKFYVANKCNWPKGLWIRENNL